MLKNIFNLFYPEICLCCNKNLVNSEKHICSYCLVELPYTQHHKNTNNDLIKIFWGRTIIQSAWALFYYRKGGAVQKILQGIKYQDQKDLSRYLGRCFATLLIDVVKEMQIDAVVAIPLHKSRIRKRGYNQSELIAQSMADVLKINSLSSFLKRNVATKTQTRKGRIDRLDNVSNIFSVTNSNALKNKHILLVDDVITTGATIESCANEILKIEGCKISIASLAFAKSQ